MNPNYTPGMLLCFKWDNDSFGICKLIKFTETKKEPIGSIVTYSIFLNTLPESVSPDQLKPLIAHMPMALSSLTDCVPVGTAEVRTQDLEAYERWLNAWHAGRAGIFSKSIADAVNEILEAVAKVDIQAFR